MIYICISLILVLIYTNFYIFKLQKSNSSYIKKISTLKEENRLKISQKTTFLATASHDLQQPHQAVGLFLASINQEKLDLENMRIINKAKDAHQTTSRLLQQLFDISKLDTATTPDIKSIALHELIHALGMKFMPVAACYGVELRIRQRDAYVMTDPVLLERMLTNILLNAFRHAKKANILLSLRKKTMDGEAKWLIEVYDTGIGIPEDKQALIFQEFVRLSKTEEKNSGLGLGLSIVNRLSGKLNHPVGLRSKLGKGSCFYIQLDAIDGTDRPQTARFTTDSIIRERMKVAIINEHMILRDSLETLLLSWGCHAKAFASSGKALHAITEQAWKPDAIIIDGILRNTQLNLEDIQDIRDLSGHDMPMILISEDTNSTFAKEAQNFGFALLANPVQANVLRDLLGDR
ncbi:MAG: hybrid sensor histidine kinase/response regulator [Ghiorsea sp.]